MGFNYAKEKRQFDLEWKLLQKEYADAGMSPSAIEAMHSYGWEMFLSRRTYENHTQALPDTYLSGEIDGKQSTLFKRFSSLSVTFDEEDFSGHWPLPWPPPGSTPWPPGTMKPCGCAICWTVQSPAMIWIPPCSGRSPPPSCSTPPGRSA